MLEHLLPTSLANLRRLKHSFLARRLIRPIADRLRARPAGTARVAPPVDLEQQIFHLLVEPGDQCIDVGASHGIVTCLFAALAGPSGRIVSFEPNPTSYQRLCENVRRLDRDRTASVITVPAALGSVASIASLSIPHDPGMASLARLDLWQTAQQDSAVQSRPCVVLTLDWVAEFGVTRPSLVKVDVEGAELLILQAGERLLAEARPLLFLECFAPWEAAFDYQPVALLEWLAAHGYQVLLLCPDGLHRLDPAISTSLPAEFELGYNLIAFRPELHEDRVGRLAELHHGPTCRALSVPPPPRPNR